MKRDEVAAAIEGSGWQLLTSDLCAQVVTGSLAQAATVAAQVARTAGVAGDGHLRLDVRADRLLLTLSTLAAGTVTSRDVELARAISATVTGLSLGLDPGVEAGSARSVQLVEIGIDAMDIAAIRPFWKAVLGYADEPGNDGPEDAVVDPQWQGPTIWFQQMDAPRPQRNRIHFDVKVPYGQARQRIEAAIAAGGRLTYDAEAPAFWVLADPEGNQACVCTWAGRDG